ncbi:hypothetical protein M153_1100062203 [Pseudoloma neurophilia]|uniref:Uncharacterized protein n=1 Tax=Pseudoloma neurophilia TaxID=146866 RepID=A0A0R0M788_9MICR|nr:hypothetical protein M153_1100062203 [Pseudoloma neurophilia]
MILSVYFMNFFQQHKFSLKNYHSHNQIRKQMRKEQSGLLVYFMKNN